MWIISCDPTCDNCNKTFKCKIEFERHFDARNIIEQVGAEENSENYLKLRQHFCGEKCFGIFKAGRLRDDGLPNLFLNSEECWHATGQSCPDIPDAIKHPPEDYTVVNDDGLVADLDFYEPNLHVAMDIITSLKQNRNKHYFHLDLAISLMNKYTGMTETWAVQKIMY